MAEHDRLRYVEFCDIYDHEPGDRKWINLDAATGWPPQVLFGCGGGAGDGTAVVTDALGQTAQAQLIPCPCCPVPAGPTPPLSVYSASARCDIRTKIPI
jgi:hypothetical protein